MPNDDAYDCAWDDPTVDPAWIPTARALWREREREEHELRVEQRRRQHAAFFDTVRAIREDMSSAISAAVLTDAARKFRANLFRELATERSRVLWSVGGAPVLGIGDIADLDACTSITRAAAIPTRAGSYGEYAKYGEAEIVVENPGDEHRLYRLRAPYQSAIDAYVLKEHGSSQAQLASGLVAARGIVKRYEEAWLGRIMVQHANITPCPSSAVDVRDGEEV